MEKLLTIVIPVYKVEAYIRKCLDSLIIDPALMARMDVLIVNDGTPDRSAEISREYVNRFPGIFRQIDKENGGHGSAWNVGLKEAEGKYLRFLDSDDWLGNLDCLMRDLSQRDEDIVFHPYEKHYLDDNRTIRVGTTVPAGETTTITSQLWGDSDRGGYLCINFWNSTYKTSILKPLVPLFAEGVFFDDFILTWAPLVYGRTCIAFDYPVYHYLIGRPGQSMSLTRKRKVALSYDKCFQQFEKVRSQILVETIPPDLLSCIDQSIVGYANLVFSYLPFLPFKDARVKMHHLWDKYLRDYSGKTKLTGRYGGMPFLFFYLFEQLRFMKNSQCKRY